MTIKNITQNSLLWLITLAALLGCEDKSTESKNPVVEQAPAEQQAQVASNSQVEIPQIQLQALPASINLDPCQLLTKEELGEIGLPDDQHLGQEGLSQQLPNHSPITPFIGCKWRSVDQATPLGWVHIQQIKGDFKPQVDESFGLGEASWKRSYQGRDQLVVKIGDRLVMVASQIPYNDMSGMDSNVWIAKKVLNRLPQITESTSLQPANASLVGGPSIDICAASGAANPHQLLQGDVAWRFANFEINHQPSQNARPQEDGVSCIYSSNRRGSINVTYLGTDGVKRWNQHFEKNGDKVAFQGKEAFRDRKKLYIPLAQGGIMVEARGIKYFTDEEINQKIDKIATLLLEQLK